MTDDDQDLEPIDLSRAPYAPEPPAAASTGSYGAAPGAPAWAPGWYADPWTAGQYRYWNGQSWTGETNRWGPATTNAGAAREATDPWPAAASPIAGGYGWSGPPPAAPAARVGAPRRRGPMVAGIVALVIVLVVSAAIGYAINSSSHSGSRSVQVAPSTTTPGTSPSSKPKVTSPPGRVATPDPDARALDQIGVRQADVPSTRSVMLITNGNELSEATLNLCNGNYPSEALRTARVQLGDFDSKGVASLSTEAVLYRNADATAQAFKELRDVTRACPHKPVVSPVGGDTEETEFHAAPDASWKSTPGVERQAYSLTTTTAAGEKSSTIAVYLRRGRALLGIYFPQPKGAQPPVAGQGSVEGIVGVFEARMARLPASVVNADRS